jgi:hypothetical protein
MFTARLIVSEAASGESVSTVPTHDMLHLQTEVHAHGFDSVHSQGMCVA